MLSHLSQLTAFLKNIVYEFGRRWNEESKPECKVPHVSIRRPHQTIVFIDLITQSRRLTLEIRRELVRCLRTPAFLAMFSTESDTVSNVQSALKSMTIMEPDLIVPPVIERAIPSLEALVEVRSTRSALIRGKHG
jgi:proteasome activator subunit 4